jgi:hypothetical protein
MINVMQMARSNPEILGKWRENGVKKRQTGVVEWH